MSGSFEIMPIVLYHSRAEPLAKLVLIGIANHEGDGGAWPTIETLCKYTARGERAVQRAIRELEDLKEVVVHFNEGGDRSTAANRRPNRYEITLECPSECDRSRWHRCPQPAEEVNHRGVICGPDGVSDPTPKKTLENTPNETGFTDSLAGPVENALPGVSEPEAIRSIIADIKAKIVPAPSLDLLGEAPPAPSSPPDRASTSDVHGSEGESGAGTLPASWCIHGHPFGTCLECAP